MSRIGNAPITLPKDIEVKVDSNVVTVKSKNLEEKLTLSAGISINVDG